LTAVLVMFQMVIRSAGKDRAEIIARHQAEMAAE